MNRLTKYDPHTNTMFPYELIDGDLSTKLDSIHKLGQLEDIEDELGIYLVTLFKALKNGVWVKGYGTTEIIFWISCADDNKLLIDSKECGLLQVEDYGKTWALTREGLEDE